MGLAAATASAHARGQAPPSALPGLPSPALSRTTYSPVVALRPLTLCAAHALLSAIAPLLSTAVAPLEHFSMAKTKTGEEDHATGRACDGKPEVQRPVEDEVIRL
ncbi:hypothetical protein TRIUR3_16377 [Triticum urartu]|uniref:Uncharacterized protein n=1 Tax=Triticum urartu TaxID=4572 RepID=M8ARD4_TRIUA|nr:hypothetical protein TRIUR3_16377 [Triticum urartu]